MFSYLAEKIQNNNRITHDFQNSQELIDIYLTKRTNKEKHLIINKLIDMFDKKSIKYFVNNGWNLMETPITHKFLNSIFDDDIAYISDGKFFLVIIKDYVIQAKMDTLIIHQYVDWLFNQFPSLESVINYNGNLNIRDKEAWTDKSLFDRVNPKTVIYDYEINDPLIIDKLDYFTSRCDNFTEELIIHLDTNKSLRVELVDTKKIYKELNVVFLNEFIESSCTWMIYHGVLAQNITKNYFLNDVNHYDSDDESSLRLVSFITKLKSDYASYIAKNFSAVCADRSIFITDKFFLGVYEDGLNFSFFDDNEREKFIKILIEANYGWRLGMLSPKLS